MRCLANEIRNHHDRLDVLINNAGIGAGSPMGPVETGIKSELYVAISPELEGITGQYFDETRRASAHAQAYDNEARRKLWRLSESLAGLGA